MYVEDAGGGATSYRDEFSDSTITNWTTQNDTNGATCSTTAWDENTTDISSARDNEDADCDNTWHRIRYDTSIAADIWCKAQRSDNPRATASNGELGTGFIVRDDGASGIEEHMLVRSAQDSGTNWTIESFDLSVSETPTIVETSISSTTQGNFDGRWERLEWAMIMVSGTDAGDDMEVKVWSGDTSEPADCNTGDSNCGWGTPNWTLTDAEMNNPPLDTGNYVGLGSKFLAGGEGTDAEAYTTWECGAL